MTVTRRQFLAATTGAAATLASASVLRGQSNTATIAPTNASKYDGLTLGIQSYSLRDRSFAKMLEALVDPLGLAAVEIFPGHIQGQSPRAIAEQLAAKNVKAMSYGVVGFGIDDAKNRKEFELAKALGLSNLSADPDPDPKCFESLEQLTEEFGVTIAIHPHGPGHRWGKREQLEQAFKDRSTRIGLCGDTGHLIRAGEDPLTILRAFADRLHAIHLKDFKKLEGDNKWQDVPAGDATLDVAGIIRFLKDSQFKGGVFIEYEGDHPVEAIQTSLARVAQAAG